MRDLTLMRRFTMRGNALKRLDETTFGYVNYLPANEPDLVLANLKNQFQSSKLQINKLFYPDDLNRLGQFLETYPGLARYLASHMSRNQSNSSEPGADLQFLLDQSPSSNLNATIKSYLRNQLLEMALKSMVKVANFTKPIGSREQSLESDLDDLGEAQTSSDNHFGIEFNLQDETNELPESFEGEISSEDANSIAVGLSENQLGQAMPAKQNQHQDRASSQFKAMGFYWRHLQELDLGQCQLTYIKWTTFEHLNELKRLYLDGNKLRLVGTRFIA